MRAFICTEKTKFDIEADSFKNIGDNVLVFNGDKVVAIVKLDNLVEAHLSEEKK